MLKPTLIAGVAAGFLAGIPGINLFNSCTCCSLVIAGGFLASYLYSNACKSAGTEFSPGSGALVGLIAGAFYAITTTIVGGMFEAVIGDPVTKGVLEWLQQQPNLPPELEDTVDQALDAVESSAFRIVGMIWDLFYSVLVGAIFSTIGGLIGGALFKVSAAPPAPTTPVDPAS